MADVIANVLVFLTPETIVLLDIEGFKNNKDSSRGQRETSTPKKTQSQTQKPLIKRHRSEEYWLMSMDAYFLNENTQYLNMPTASNRGEDQMRKPGNSFWMSAPKVKVKNEITLKMGMTI